MSVGILLNHNAGGEKILWIYNRGTWGGGVSSIAKTSGSGTVNLGSSYITLTDWPGMPNTCYYSTNAKIDVTKYKTLYIRVRRTNTSDYGGQSFRFGLSSSRTGINGTNTGFFKPTSETLKALDISGATGSYYITFQDSNWNQNTNDYIYEIYLEK